MSIKVVSLVLLVLFAFAIVTNVVMAANIQLSNNVATTRNFSCDGNPGNEPTGDPVDGPPSPG